jgi:hypothetical protein
MILHLFLPAFFFLAGLVTAAFRLDELVYIVWIAVFNPGATQLVYEVPLLLYFHRRNERGKFRGVLIAIGLTILINGACWVAITGGKFRLGG